MLRADDHALAVERRRDAVRHEVLHVGVALAVREALVGGSAHHRAGHRVGEVLLQAGSQAKHLVIIPTVKGKHARHLRAASVSVPVLSNTMTSACAMDSKC